MTDSKEYTNDEITVVWKPKLCIHSGNCVRGLGSVFNPKDRPWIKMHSASSEDVIKTVNNCPSGALTYERNNKMSDNKELVSKDKSIQAKTKMQIFDGGPIMVEGPCAIIGKDGSETIKEGKFFLCRCGGSKNKPYCDGAHKSTEFDK